MFCYSPSSSFTPCIRFNGQPARKPSDGVKPADLLALTTPEKYVSRGGLKLDTWGYVTVDEEMRTSVPGPVYSASQLVFVALVSLVLYGTFVLIQAVTHRDYFLPTRAAQDERAHAEPPSNAATGFSGLDSFTYVANDGLYDSLPATVSITVFALTSAPTAVNDSYSTPANTPLNVLPTGILANDTDPQGAIGLDEDPFVFAGEVAVSW